MSSISARDAAALLAIVHDGAVDETYDPIPFQVLSALAHLIASDAPVGYNETEWAPEFRVVDEVQVVQCSMSPSVIAALPTWGWQNPMRNCARRDEQRAVRLSELLTPQQRRRLEYDAAVWRPLGIEDSIAVWLPAPPGRARSVYLERSAGSYTQRDVTLLTLLRPHLVRMRLNAESRRHLTGLDGLTAREAEILGWIARGKRDREIARLLFISPHTVGKHVEHIFEKLGIHTRSAAAAYATSKARAAAQPRTIPADGL